MVYDEKVHAERLMKILENDKTCNMCPAGRRYGRLNVYNMMWSNRPCRVCWKFIKSYDSHSCPCHKLGAEEATKRSWLALEEKGHI